MCGIAGFAGSISPTELRESLRRMLLAQVQRGPDDEGISVLEENSGLLGLGSRRLAIIDVSSLGHQPMVNPDTGDILVHNGEIYNFLELRRELEDLGFCFRSRTDTEVILRAYQQWNVRCLERFNGMFAFALWDAAKRHLLLARDPLGIKPLYYSFIRGKGFLFASEVRALLSSGLISADLDLKAVAGFLAYGAVQEPLTIIRAAQALASGSWMQVDIRGEKLREGRFWNLPVPSVSSGRKETLIDEGRDLFQKAVRRHLISDVPLGIFLSSGLDSTAVLGQSIRERPEGVHAFTVSFPDFPELDESPIARNTAARLGAHYHEYPVDSACAMSWVHQGLEKMDQPSMDGLNTYIVSRAVREQGLAVALSGQGGDEVFGGYRTFRAVPRWLRRNQWLNLAPASVRSALLRLATSHTSEVFQEKARDLIRARSDLLSVYFHYRRLLSDSDLAALGFQASELGLTTTFHCPEAPRHACVVADDEIASVQRLETVFYLGNTLLRDGDVFGMANSLEIRVPFLDRELVEWVFRLPGKAVLPKGSSEKHLLRLICAGFYTPELTNNKKRGFALPFSSWLLGPLNELTEDYLNSLKTVGLLRANGVDRIYSSFKREPWSPAWSRLWSLVILAHWLKMHTLQPV
ncbi:MAG: asparagine synthase (glutamine-hydrolyzing) [Acidobacteria bacterium]|nr:asparagine synthase (glutamine-hydrolyzing) [Acidobacteriota bacterium]